MPIEPRQSSSWRWITGVFALVIASFIAASAFVHYQLRPVDLAARAISANTAPGIERLADARGELRQLQKVLDDDVVKPEPLVAARRAVDEPVYAYLALPVLPEEHALWTRVATGRAELESAVGAFVADTRAHGSAADRGRLTRAVAVLFDALTDTIRANATHTLGFAERIQDFRERSTSVASALYILCTTLAVASAVFVSRLLRARAALVEQHRRLERERASELEAFAGRVAHDILSPLGTAGMAFELLRAPHAENRRGELIERGSRAVDRIKTLVSGLLEFARAGGKPEDDARSDLAAVVADVVTSLQPEARSAGAELTAPAVVRQTVACNSGVLMSLLSNLARNAIKYLGDATERRVQIRARERGGCVRVEVADTGPGVPWHLQARIFEPYVRAPSANQPGVGLGLATVKRLAEAHGGSVGVDSGPAGGSTFWFELPAIA